MKVKYVKPYGWSIWNGATLIEGGFSSKDAAKAYIEKEYDDEGLGKGYAPDSVIGGDATYARGGI